VRLKLKRDWVEIMDEFKEFERVETAGRNLTVPTRKSTGLLRSPGWVLVFGGCFAPCCSFALLFS